MTAVRVLINTAALAALTLIAFIPLSAAYAESGFWIAAGGGTLLGAVIAVLGWRFRWHPLTVAAVVTATYFVFGGALVLRGSSLFGFVPTLDVFVTLAAGVVQSWKQALTVQAPFTGFEQLGIVPYIAGLIASTVGVSLALRLRRALGAALIAPGTLLVLAVAFSTYLGRVPALVGAAWVGGALAWLLWRSSVRRADAALDDSEQDPPAQWYRRIVPIVGILAVALTVGSVAATAAPMNDRTVLRDHIVPPLDLHDYASPLTMFRKYVRDGTDATLFTVQGLPAGVPVRLATLDLYDGVVYKVSGSGGGGSGVFERVGREIEPTVTGEHAEVTVTIDQLRGVWLPTVGYSDGLRFDGDDAGPLSSALHYNSASGTAIVTTGLTSGDTYQTEAVIPAVPAEDELLHATLAPVKTPAPRAVPDEIAGLVDKVTAGATTPIEQVRAIEAYFQTSGFFSSGLEGQAISRSGHTVDRESQLLSGTQMIGDGEQYAVAMALMVSQLGIPVRVVMGFRTDAAAESVAITGDQLAAWVEVPFEQYGWVPFSPTPSKDRVPQQETPQQSQKPQAQVAQPPQTPQEPAELPPTSPLDESEKSDQPLDLAWLWTTLRVAGMSLVLLAVLLGPSVALGVARLSRRRKRRDAASSVDRVDGAWAELMDAAADVGAPVSAGATRREHARAIDEHYPTASVGALAARADAAVFGAGEPGDEEAAQFWAIVDETTNTLRSAVPWYRRMLALAFPVSVVRAIRLPRRIRVSSLWPWPRRERSS